MNLLVAVGIVEFAEPAEARTAFKKLAYSKFFNVPLYLEWAPIGVFNRPASKQDVPRLLPAAALAGDSKVKEDRDPVSKIIEPEFEPVDENAVPELDTTLFVKNLNFKTIEAPLKKVIF